jgi:hypothetical protein
MLLAITLPPEPGITVSLVNGLPVQVGEPRLNVPRRRKDCHSLACLASHLALFLGGIVDLPHPRCDREAISIHYYN